MLEAGRETPCALYIFLAVDVQLYQEVEGAKEAQGRHGRDY